MYRRCRSPIFRRQGRDIVLYTALKVRANSFQSHSNLCPLVQTTSRSESGELGPWEFDETEARWFHSVFLICLSVSNTSLLGTVLACFWPAIH
jgi:hypothetical protein